MNDTSSTNDMRQRFDPVKYESKLYFVEYAIPACGNHGGIELTAASLSTPTSQMPFLHSQSFSVSKGSEKRSEKGLNGEH